MASEFRGEVRPRRSPPKHHIVMSAARHDLRPVDDPFAPISNSQFPQLYIRSTMRNTYRSYMRAKTPYTTRVRT
jgi:hypothetical protein